MTRQSWKQPLEMSFFPLTLMEWGISGTLNKIPNDSDALFLLNKGDQRSLTSSSLNWIELTTEWTRSLLMIFLTPLRSQEAN